MHASRERLLQRVSNGDVAALARMLSLIERRSPDLPDYLAALHRRGGEAHVIGITGPAGSGKSTLVTRLVEAYRRRGKTVAVIAVDPSSEFTGGAILGDRIRMGAAAGDPGVFIRSMATRGALGGLARAALDAVTVFAAAEKDIVLIETVGVGQAEVDVVSVAQSIVVVSVPGLGDDVQASKAGLMEIGDIHAVNKADREGAQRVAADLKENIRLGRREPGAWRPPVHLTTAEHNDGVEELIDLLDKHHDWMSRSGELAARLRRNVEARIRWAAQDLVRDHLNGGVNGSFKRAVDDVLARRIDPMAVATDLLSQFSERTMP